MKYIYNYPMPAITADVVLLYYIKETKKFKVYLIIRGNKDEPFYNHPALPGGFMEINETLEECAKRELYEETGTNISTLKYLGVYDDVDRDKRKRVVDFAFYKLLSNEERINTINKTPEEFKHEIKGKGWFLFDDIKDELAFDHKQIIQDAITKIENSNNDWGFK